MINDWERQHPGRVENMARAMGNITLSHLMDRNLFPFTTLVPSGRADAGGDKAFDDDDEACAPNATTTGSQVVTLVRPAPAAAGTGWPSSD